MRGLGLVPPPPRHVQLGGVSATGANRVLQIGHRYEMLLAAAVEHGPHDDIVLGEAELAQAVSLSLEIIIGDCSGCVQGLVQVPPGPPTGPAGG